MHPGNEHVVRPNDKRQNTNEHESPNHQPIAEDIFAGMDRNQVRDNPKRRQGHDVNLWMAKEPEQMLEQQRLTAIVRQCLTKGHNRRHEETGPDLEVQDHHDRAYEQCWECQ